MHMHSLCCHKWLNISTNARRTQYCITTKMLCPAKRDEVQQCQVQDCCPACQSLMPYSGKLVESFPDATCLPFIEVRTILYDNLLQSIIQFMLNLIWAAQYCCCQERTHQSISQVFTKIMVGGCNEPTRGNKAHQVQRITESWILGQAMKKYSIAFCADKVILLTQQATEYSLFQNTVYPSVNFNTP